MISRSLSYVLGATCALVLASAPADAQSLSDYPTTPDLSLAASATQTVGVTEMSIEYSSPAARGREIWGGLVPYGELWRAGANAPTKVTFGHDVTIGGSEVPAGSYTLVILPEEGAWTAIFNTDSSGRGAYAYDESEDVARVAVTPEEAPFRERMLFVFDGTTNSATDLTLEWAGLKAAIPISVDTEAIVEANMAATFGSLWRPQYAAARYLLDNDGDLDRAAELMTASIAIDSNWWNNWFMAKIENARGEDASARQHAEAALELGAGDGTFDNFFKADVEAALAEWPSG